MAEPPLEGERPIRFGCGALVGLAVGLRVAVGATDAWGAAAAVALAAGLLTGWLAMRFGDRFWEALANVLRW